ncbi:helix-turn-helix domain-containing protein [Ureaplasma urealyticum]|uniref:Helix-turn-helix transcriptional regulator n=1 Tax=Ureaplasma urealyticum TaxID=2130 RepID=A0AAP9ACQ4_UREUR|nr:helix-turn-helix transcriptional regulator [Ureaplasma urealyticum]MCF1349190.1 helix-turn-helix transcriptional regulator [Ureaplasma urealyticum]MDU3864534.1 helix-turn-helix transcriptional regulator [Ureaplasma urealyticum]QDI63892.1 helix-turn-helix transcriptional regulator [Ureaplasma urealyticum]QDI65092.1 helix-turn-helix transcriptional regulator [Ureaplasma urealyticum]RCJ00551.1 XRE family transcriptional regulator [Ureaplasma urealyticum]
MALSYNKLWKLLIDKEINKTDLAKLTGLSKSTIAKLSKGENINTEVLERICIALKCDIEDIVELKESNQWKILK